MRAWLFPFFIPLSMACGGGGKLLGLAQNALNALPNIPQPAANGLTGDPLPNDFTLKQFFALQCQHGLPGDPHGGSPVANYCPTGVPTDVTTEFNAEALLGLIFDTDREASDVFRDGYTQCQVGEGAGPISLSAASFVSSDGGDPRRYVIDMDPLFTCVGHGSFAGASKYWVYSKQADKKILLATRKHDLSDPAADQSNVYEIYLSPDSAGHDHVLAFNEAGTNGSASNDFGERAILLANFETRRFLVQFRSQGHTFLTAAGTGGITVAGAYQPGAYFARTDATPAGLCVDNATRLQAPDTSCAIEKAPWSGAADAAAYLDMTATEASDLTPFLASFAAGPTAVDMPAAAAPSGGADAVNIPDFIQ